MALTPYQRRNMRMVHRRTGHTAAQEAARDGDLPLVQAYLDAGYPAGQLMEMATYAREHRVFWALVDHGVSIDHPRADGQTPLMHAAHHPDLAFVKRLVAAGANLNAVTDDGISVMSQAALGRDPAVVRCLLEAGALPNPGAPVVPHWSALHWAMSYGFDRGGLGGSPSASVRQQGIAIAHLLLNAGADVNLENPDGDTPFLMVLKGGAQGERTQTMLDAMLQAGADVNRLSTGGNAHLAPLGAVMGVYFDRGNFDWLMAQAPEMDAPVSYGHLPLENALDHGSFIKMDNQAYCTQRLLGEGANPQAVIGKHGSPFLKFLGLWSSSNRGDAVFRTPAMWEAWTTHPGFQVDAPDAQGRSALLGFLDDAPMNVDTVQRLLALGSNVNLVGTKGHTPLMALIMRRWDTAALVADGMVVLQNLLDAGADPQAGIHRSDHNGQPSGLSLLHLAVRHHAPLPMLQRLLDLGLPVNAACALGNTPLHLAASQGIADHVALLLKHGADGSALNLDGERPYERVNPMAQDAVTLMGELLADHERRELRQVSLPTGPGQRPRSRL